MLDVGVLAHEGFLVDEQGLDHVEDGLVLVKLELHLILDEDVRDQGEDVLVLVLVEVERLLVLDEDVLVQGEDVLVLLVLGEDVLDQDEDVLVPPLELVVDELGHPHYGDVGLHWSHDAMVIEVDALRCECAKTLMILSDDFECWRCLQ